MGKLWAHILIATCLGSAAAVAATDEVAPPSLEIVISVAEQKLALVKDGGLVRKYPISTSKFGLGDSYNSYKTPLGHLRVCDKIGNGLAAGSVLKSRSATGEVLPANAPGRDPIVTRILWLEGLESGNAAAKARGIYIHGTVEEAKLGQPVSYGCIRMRSHDVMELFDETPLGTPVEIIADHFPRFQKTPAKETLFASNVRPSTVVGPHGMVMVKTVPGGEPPMMAKAKPAPTLMLFADLKPATPPASKPVAGKPAEAPAKTLAKATAPEPIGLGPKVVLRAPPAAEPRVMFAMTDSILESDLHQPAKPAPAPAAPAAPPAPTVEHRVAEEAQTPRSVVLQVVAPIDPFLPANDAAARAPLDHLSTYLLNPPAPQFRLAFRAVVAAPDL